MIEVSFLGEPFKKELAILTQKCLQRYFHHICNRNDTEGSGGKKITELSCDTCIQMQVRLLFSKSAHS